MKKIAKISLVTALAVAGFATNSFAADTLAEAFTNGKESGAVKSYYYAQTFDGAGKNDVAGFLRNHVPEYAAHTAEGGIGVEM